MPSLLESRQSAELLPVHNGANRKSLKVKCLSEVLCSQVLTSLLLRFFFTLISRVGPLFSSSLELVTMTSTVRKPVKAKFARNVSVVEPQRLFGRFLNCFISALVPILSHPEDVENQEGLPLP